MKNLILILGMVLLTSSAFAHTAKSEASIFLGADKTIVYIAGEPAQKLYDSLDVNEKQSFDLVAEGTSKLKDSVECFRKTRELTEELDPAQYICTITLPK